MKCIVGLGNPGSRYKFTRHNVGFLAIEYLIGRFRARHNHSNELYECYDALVDGCNTILVMPQTYMNNSGMAVREILQRYEVAMEDLMVMYDDFQLPFGTIRTRPKGSDGGHNGLASIIYHVQSDLIPRLRIGVGGTTMPEHHTHEIMAEYVLTPFQEEEQKFLPQLLQYAGDACILWMTAGIQKTMSLYNKNFLRSADAE